MLRKINSIAKEIKRLSKKSFDIYKNQGLTSLTKRTRDEIKRRYFIKDKDNLLESGLISVEKLLNDRFTNIQPIKTIKITRNNYRLNIVTDSLDKDSFFGGVATSLILATQFSNKYKIPLRIITRAAKSSPLAYTEFLNLFKLEKPEKIEYFSDFDRNSNKNHYNLTVSEKDIFLATSWWTAEVIKSINLRKNFFYILQEVEEYFYPNGDEQFLCRSILGDKNINFIVNSKLLYDYYDSMGYQNIINRGIYFEPAFPENIYFYKEKLFRKKPLYKLFFYSRPNNPRNLFFTGLKILDEALFRNIIDKNEWKIYFAGSDIPSIKFKNGVKPIILGRMDWNKYSQFIKSVDLGFCLMYTPHPSYPPLDIASSGGIVLTNKYANKTCLNYSKNIICEHLDIESMLEGFSAAVELAKNSKERNKNYLSNRIERNWEKSFEKSLLYIKENI